MFFAVDIYSSHPKSRCYNVVTMNKNDVNFDFDLPVVDGPAASRLRVHNNGESTCVSCEG